MTINAYTDPVFLLHILASKPCLTAGPSNSVDSGKNNQREATSSISSPSTLNKLVSRFERNSQRCLHFTCVGDNIAILMTSINIKEKDPQMLLSPTCCHAETPSTRKESTSLTINAANVSLQMYIFCRLHASAGSTAHSPRSSKKCDMVCCMTKTPQLCRLIEIHDVI